MDEQRLSPRRPFAAKGSLVMGTSLVLPIKTFDIGSGGIGAFCESPVEVGAKGQVVVSFYADGGLKKIIATCSVAHCIYGGGGFKIGLTFQQLSPDSIPVLSAYLRPT